jgi:hypothetical protein
MGRGSAARPGDLGGLDRKAGVTSGQPLVRAWVVKTIFIAVCGLVMIALPLVIHAFSADRFLRITCFAVGGLALYGACFHGYITRRRERHSHQAVG